MRAYHGDREISKTHVTRMRNSMPASTDYWVNDTGSEPLFVIPTEANRGLAEMLPILLKEVRKLVADRRATSPEPGFECFFRSNPNHRYALRSPARRTPARRTPQEGLNRTFPMGGGRSGGLEPGESGPWSEFRKSSAANRSIT